MHRAARRCKRRKSSFWRAMMISRRISRRLRSGWREFGRRKRGQRQRRLVAVIAVIWGMRSGVRAARILVSRRSSQEKRFRFRLGTTFDPPHSTKTRVPVPDPFPDRLAGTGLRCLGSSTYHLSTLDRHNRSFRRSLRIVSRPTILAAHHALQGQYVFREMYKDL